MIASWSRKLCGSEKYGWPGGATGDNKMLAAVRIAVIMQEDGSCVVGREIERNTSKDMCKQEGGWLCRLGSWRQAA
jgi:hypothetical protein